MKTVAIIGTGNVAWHLGKQLKSAGYIIQYIWGRNEKDAQELATCLDAQVANKPQTCTNASCVIMAITDSAIGQVAELLPQGDFMLVHTSGMAMLDELSKHAKRGVFYPLQTLTKHTDTSFKDIPILIEANTPEVLSELRNCAKMISSKVIEVAGKDRQFVHLAAVYANNFTNHLLGIAYQILSKNDIDQGILNELIKETFTKAIQHHPAAIQTGPAKRGDVITISKHIELLRQFTEYRQIYEVLSNSISVKAKNKLSNA